MAEHGTEHGYLLDNQQSEAGIRFGALAELFDPVTFRHVDRIGITVAADPPPPGGFDLVHARLVLVHVVDRAEALRRMVQALRPGGVLLLEDADPGLQPLLCPDESGPEQRLANRLRSGFRELMAARGADLSYGRTLPRLLREAGLRDVQADAYFPITSPACTVLEAATVRQIRGRLVAAGIATDEDIDRHLAHVATGQLDLATAPMVSAWGRRP
nr:class I SAM-dependent methyltransferase [Streptomyces sp. NBC_01177]